MLSRLAALSGPILIILVFLAGGFVGMVRYTGVFDAAIGVGGRLPVEASLHHGSSPCLRYPVAPRAGSVREAADHLAAAGLTGSQLSDLIGELYARAAVQETPLHALGEVDEYIETLSRGSTLFSRMVIALKGERLRAQLASLLTATPPMKTTVAALAPEPRAAVDAEWARDPSVFVLPGLLQLSRALRVSATERTLDAALVKLERQVANGEEVRLDPAEDDWGSPLTLERTSEDELTLISLGADRMAGGAGHDADLTRTLRSKTEPPAAAPACEGKTTITLPRSELDAALANLSAISASARVMPALTDGVVTGFRVKNLKPGSFLVRAGLCDGDVVSTLNGFSLASPEKALEVYSTMRTAKRAEVKLLRASQPVTLIVELD